MLDHKAFAKWLMERADAKDGYIMCAVGQDPRTLSEWYFSGQYSGRQLDKAKYWRENANRVFDCQGLADCYVTENAGAGKVNVQARNNYASWCSEKGEGKIPPEKRTEGAAVFIYGAAEKYITHVGFLVRPVNEGNRAGDWYVVEARGVMYGVVTTKLSERPWNRWGLMDKYFDYGRTPVIAGDAYGARNLMRGMAGSDVKALQADLIAAGYSCGSYGADGDFGRATESAVKAFQLAHGLETDGIAGPKTFAELNGLFRETGEIKEIIQGDKTVTVIMGKTWNIRTDPSVQGSRIMGIARNGESFEPGNAEADGWINIVYNGESAWISEKAVKA